jgi:hypothetical protein
MREAHRRWQKRAPEFRRYRRAMDGSFKAFNDAVIALEQVKAMRGPAPGLMTPLSKRLARSAKTVARVKAPEELARAHGLIQSAWELADSAFRLRMTAVTQNSVDVAQRASSAAAGALMLYNRARSDQQAAMEPPRPHDAKSASWGPPPARK